jgi:hypothetical protein
VNVLGRRVARLERGRSPSACLRCEGKCIGVHFLEATPQDYDDGPDGTPGPFPVLCPACGRRIPKTYVLEHRHSWRAV